MEIRCLWKKNYIFQKLLRKWQYLQFFQISLTFGLSRRYQDSQICFCAQSVEICSSVCEENLCMKKTFVYEENSDICLKKGGTFTSFQIIVIRFLDTTPNLISDIFLKVNCHVESETMNGNFIIYCIIIHWSILHFELIFQPCVILSHHILSIGKYQFWQLGRSFKNQYTLGYNIKKSY